MFSRIERGDIDGPDNNCIREQEDICGWERGAAIAPCARLGEGGNDDDTRMVESKGGFGGWIEKGGRERWEGGFDVVVVVAGFFAKTAQLGNQLERSWPRRRRRRIALISTVPLFCFRCSIFLFVQLRTHTQKRLYCITKEAKRWPKQNQQEFVKKDRMTFACGTCWKFPNNG